MAVAVGVFGCSRTPQRVTVENLAAILHHARMVEARLSGPFLHSPCKPLRGSGRLVNAADCSYLPPSGSAEAAALARFTLTVESVASRHPSAESLRACGLTLLVQARAPRALDRAVALLARAAALAPLDAATASDLAAAYLVRAEREDAPRDLVHALELAHQALALNPHLAEARFNLALAREQLHLQVQAATAWRAYLQIDSRSPWAHEASARLAGLDAEKALQLWSAARERLRSAAERGEYGVLRDLARRFTQAVRLYVWEQTLPEWAHLHLAGEESRARRALEASRSIGNVLTEVEGDSLIDETVAGIASGYRMPSSRRLAALASGLDEYGRGVRAYEQNAMRDAAAHFAAAASVLGKASSPFAAAAEIAVATTSYQGGDYDDALRRLQGIAAEPAHRRHPTLVGRAQWIAGLCSAAVGHPIETIAADEAALRAFEASHEWESAVASHSMLANALDGVDETDRAWRHRIAALAGAPDLHSLRRRHAVYNSAALAAGELDLPVAALDFQQESVAWALRSGNALDIAGELRMRAAVESRLAMDVQALADLRRALALGVTLEEPLRGAVLSEIDDVSARLWRARDPARAVQLEQSALELLRRSDSGERLAAAYLDLALAQLARGEAAAAELSLTAGIDVQERIWRHLAQHLDEQSATGAWPDFIARQRAIFDQLILLQARAGRAGDAFETAERARSWDMLLQLLAMPARPPGLARRGGLHADPPGLRRLRQGLPAGTVLIAYRIIDDQALCWTLGRQTVRLHLLRTGRALLEAGVARLDALIAGSRAGDALADTLVGLHSALLTPIAEDIRDADELIFVPDRTLASVPFAGLQDRQSRRFLVEDHAVGVAPSAAVYLSSLQRDTTLAASGPPANALAVTGVAFRRDLFPHLAPLAEAPAESAAVAASYPTTTRLQGAEATAERVLTFMGRSSVVHFASHALTVGASPLVSVMPLAPSGATDSGGLYAHDLLGRSFARTRLVVLASCAAAGEPGPRLERVSGFVRPLLDDGVPAVIASLWPVDDSFTPGFFAAFHRQFRAGADAPHALRIAQLEALRAGARRWGAPLAWAGFEAFGASAVPPRPAARPIRSPAREGR